MKHESCRALYRYWDRIRDGERAPARAAVEPAEISGILSDTFILQSGNGSYRFRLAGTRLCAIYGKELKGCEFLDFWDSEDRDQLSMILSAIVTHGHSAVVGVTANVGRHQNIGLELLLLPLVQAGPHYDRILGVMAPMELPHWLGLVPIARQTVTSVRLMSPTDGPAGADFGRLQPALVPSPPIKGPKVRRESFVILEGGKSV